MGLKSYRSDGFWEQNKIDPRAGWHIRLNLAVTFCTDLAKCRYFVWCLKFWWLDFYFLGATRDPTLKNMANRDNDNDKNGRKNQLFSIDGNAFESEDDDYANFDVPSEKAEKPKPKDMASSQAKSFAASQTVVAPALQVSLFLLRQSLSNVLDVGNLFCGSKGLFR